MFLPTLPTIEDRLSSKRGEQPAEKPFRHGSVGRFSNLSILIPQKEREKIREFANNYLATLPPPHEFQGSSSRMIEHRGYSSASTRLECDSAIKSECKDRGKRAFSSFSMLTKTSTSSFQLDLIENQLRQMQTEELLPPKVAAGDDLIHIDTSMLKKAEASAESSSRRHYTGLFFSQPIPKAPSWSSLPFGPLGVIKVSHSSSRVGLLSFEDRSIPLFLNNRPPTAQEQFDRLLDKYPVDKHAHLRNRANREARQEAVVKRQEERLKQLEKRKPVLYARYQKAYDAQRSSFARNEKAWDKHFLKSLQRKEKVPEVAPQKKKKEKGWGDKTVDFITTYVWKKGLARIGEGFEAVTDKIGDGCETALTPLDEGLKSFREKTGVRIQGEVSLGSISIGPDLSRDKITKTGADVPAQQVKKEPSPSEPSSISADGPSKYTYNPDVDVVNMFFERGKRLGVSLGKHPAKQPFRVTQIMARDDKAGRLLLYMGEQFIPPGVKPAYSTAKHAIGFYNDFYLNYLPELEKNNPKAYEDYRAVMRVTTSFHPVAKLVDMVYGPDGPIREFYRKSDEARTRLQENPKAFYGESFNQAAKNPRYSPGTMRKMAPIVERLGIEDELDDLAYKKIFGKER